MIRAKEKRIYTTNKGKMNINEIADHRKGKYSFTYKGINDIEKTAKASAIKVSHKDFKEPFYLVIETIHNENDIRVYLTNIDCSNKEGVRKALKGYRLRWRIEEYFRFVKQEYEFEKFMIRSLDGINNLSGLIKEFKQSYYLDEILNILSQYNSGFCSEAINKGKWYIEEE